MTIRIQSNARVSINVDRVEIQKTQKSFSLANKNRIERAKQGLEHKQQLVIDLLPLLFHVNHPMLPGYVNQKTPCGLSNFKPSKADLQTVKRVSKSFRYTSINRREAEIYSIFIMGSMGTLGQTRGSDLDIWLCHHPDLGANEIKALREKCALISEWAKEKRLELCFFLMNNENFLEGRSTPLSEESSGSTQHYLLLDEFYRSSLYLGGRQPLWWFVPSNYEKQYREYCNILLEKRFVRDNQIIDFGGLADIPVREFVTAAIWQMYKAIQSPYKSILKLLLLEVYAHEFPEPNFLAYQFKQRIEQSPEDIDTSDPYLLLLTRIEEYLQKKGLNKRLDIARRSFYFKTGRALSRERSKTAKPWQDTLLEEHIQRWGWRQDHLENLDGRIRWRATKVIDERQRLVSDLMNSYRVLSEFVRQHNSQPSPLHDEVAILGRKLYAAFERKSGKIEWINPDISPDISEPNLVFCRQDDNNDDNHIGVSDRDNRNSNGNKDSRRRRHDHHWRLYAHKSRTQIDRQAPLKTNRSLAELAIWSYCNKIFAEDSRAVIQISPEANTTAASSHHTARSTVSPTDRSLNELFSALRHWQPLPLPKPKQNSYRSKPCAKSLMLIVNMDPIDDSVQALPTLNTHRELALDPLNISPGAHSLIHSVELVVLNSWNELMVISPPPPQDSNTTLANLLTEILSETVTNPVQVLPKVAVYCQQSASSPLIAQRLESLIDKMMKCFHFDTTLKHARFMLCYQGRYHLWQQQAFLQHHHFDHLDQLYQYLAEPQPHLSPLVFDDNSLHDSPLRAMAMLPHSKAIQVGYRVLPKDSSRQPLAEIYCLDERGSLWVDQLPFRDEQSLLRPLHQFIRSAIQRLCLAEQHREFFGVYPVEFYHLKRPTNANGSWSADRIEITTDLRNLNFFNIQAIASNDSTGEGDYSFYCDDQAFHSLDYGTKIYRRVASYILARRRQAERYPCYITDLDLSHHHSGSQSVSLQLIDYLKVKSRLECALNQALQSI
ncbi:MAG: class I adenylate cyclase [Cellvibrionaceae bacterium]